MDNKYDWMSIGTMQRTISVLESQKKALMREHEKIDKKIEDFEKAIRVKQIQWIYPSFD